MIMMTPHLDYSGGPWATLAFRIPNTLSILAAHLG